MGLISERCLKSTRFSNYYAGIGSDETYEKFNKIESDVYCDLTNDSENQTKVKSKRKGKMTFVARYPFGSLRKILSNTKKNVVNFIASEESKNNSD